MSAYNDAVGSFDRRVMPQVRRIEQAGADSEREVLAPAAIEISARTITARPEPAPERRRFALPRSASSRRPPGERLAAGA